MKFLRRFHRDDEAQISFLAVAGCLCFVALLSMVINTNEVVSERVHMQDVADVAALSAASWTARGLNTISFVNVMNTKLISTAVLLNALKDAIPVINSVGTVQKAIFNACSGVPIVGVACAAAAVVVEFQLAALRVLDNIVRPLQSSLARCPSGALWNIMQALELTATGVQKSFGAIGLAESVSIARANGADFGLVVNGALADGNVQDAVFLPVTQEGFEEHCDYLQAGGRGYELQGYDQNRGPLRVGRARINDTLMLPWITMFSRPIFSGMVVSHTIQVGCTPDPNDQQQKVKVQLRNLDECRKYGASPLWTHITATTRTVLASDPQYGNLSVSDFVPWRPKREYGGSAGPGDDRDADAIRDQIDDLNLPGGVGGIAQPGSNTVTLGRGNDLIDAQNEEQINDVPRNFRCGSGDASYPFYIPRDDDEAGLLTCFIAGSCTRITRRPEFSRYSPNDTLVRSEATGTYFIRVHRSTIEEEDQPTRVQYFVEVVTLASSGETEMDQDEFRQYMADNGIDSSASNDSSGCSRKPQPWMLDTGSSQQDREAFENKLRFIGVVYSDIDTANPPFFWGNFFSESPPQLLAYGQAQVYNRLQEDTFTQDWRVRLEQASILEDLLSSGKLGSVGGKFAGEAVGSVNNH